MFCCFAFVCFYLAEHQAPRFEAVDVAYIRELCVNGFVDPHSLTLVGGDGFDVPHLDY